jgi:hypothetical protein
MTDLSTVKSAIRQKLNRLVVHPLALAKEETAEDGSKYIIAKFSFGNLLEIDRAFNTIEDAPSHEDINCLSDEQNHLHRLLHSAHSALISFFDAYGIPVEVSTKSFDEKETDTNEVKIHEVKITPVDDFNDEFFKKLVRITSKLNVSHIR